ncbi:MAG TPA: hypothetical protein VFH88_12875 [Candidatus Krumholzibacteria bacterium]|nr:hypothetical protein [Candidatus Krumholzibacteria bacterium]
MKLTHWSGMIMAAAVTVAALPVTSHATRYVAHATVSGPVAVRVWVQGGDVFPDYNHVTLWLSADRDCYTSLFIVDTDGFIHVLNMGGAYGDGWLYGGRNYSFRACDLGLDRLDGRGIAYVFAVGSPVPFDYSYYGAGVYVNGFGFRVVGDPFVACREFYTSLLPVTCRWDYVGVGYTRFYVHEWMRYPSYLCASHVHFGAPCRECASVYTTYRGNVAAPYQAMRPVVRFKDSARYNLQHVTREPAGRSRTDVRSTVAEPLTRTPIAREETRRVKSYENVRVVSTSRDAASAPSFRPVKNSSTVAVRTPATAGNGRTVAFKSGKKSVSKTNVAQKGNGKKVRQAE